MSYLQHFGIKHPVLAKDSAELFDDGALRHLKERFTWLLDSPGVGVLTGPSGVGKTVALRHLTAGMNPHRYKLIYLAETDFGRLDIYKSLAIAVGLDPPHRRAPLWRELKARILELAEHKNLLPVWIIDESQNLPNDFFRDFPSFMNFAFDSRDLMTVWLVGHPHLNEMLERSAYAALATRVQAYLQLRPIGERERFIPFIQHAFRVAGFQQTILSDSGMELLRQGCLGVPRLAARILHLGLQLAAAKRLNHLPDDLVTQAIDSLR
jgi:MSHA biogenesis protein MshM